MCRDLHTISLLKINNVQAGSVFSIRRDDRHVFNKEEIIN